MSKITHENIKKVVSRTYNTLVYYFNDDNALKFEREIQDYIKQQERDSKLLELYKEYFEYSEMLKDGRKFDGRMLVEHERDKIIEEIKELENE